MSKKFSDWHVPPEWLAQFSLLLMIPAIAVLSAILLPILNSLKTAAAFNLFYSALGIGGLGIVLLFFASFPLYRQRKFLTFGPRELPSFNRKLYWAAYLFLVASVILMGIVWLKLK